MKPNLLEQHFEAEVPNQKWVSDITYVWTEDGWLYLAVVLDLFSRMVVGCAMSHRIDRALVIAATLKITADDPATGGDEHTFKKTDSTENAILIHGNGATIDGLSSVELVSQYQVLRLRRSDDQWFIL